VPQIAFKASFFVMPLQFLGCILKNYLDVELLTKFKKHITDNIGNRVGSPSDDLEAILVH
jgi:hypothetical protein